MGPRSLLGDDEHPHPRAGHLFAQLSGAILGADIGPLNTDRGSDAFHELAPWRLENPEATLGDYLQQIVAGPEPHDDPYNLGSSRDK